MENERFPFQLRSVNENRASNSLGPILEEIVFDGDMRRYEMKAKARDAADVFQHVERKGFTTANDPLELSGRTIQVWRLRTDVSHSAITKHSRILAPDELERTERFRFDHARNSFLVTRSALRHLLGNYLQAEPVAIKLIYGKNGKPVLPPETPIQFNVAHSDGIAVLAFALNCEIGVDVERVRSFSGMAGVAARFFHPDEAARVNSVALDERERTFFETWVRKEAYLKATAEGLGAELQDFQIKSVAAFADLRLERLGQHDRAWTFHDLQLAPQYAGALAYRDHARDVQISHLLTFAELESLLAGRSLR